VSIFHLNKPFRFELISALSGVLIALQSRINGELSDQMGDSLEAALVSFGTGLFFVSLI
jgi:transporter family-2 protein